MLFKCPARHHSPARTELCTWCHGSGRVTEESIDQTNEEQEILRLENILKGVPRIEIVYVKIPLED